MAISVGQITITDVHDGASTQVEYSSSTSSSTPPSAGWGVSVPPPQTGYYVWKRERTSYADGTYSDWESPIRITGDAGQKGADGASDQLIVQYALGTWDTPPSTVVIGEESWGLGKDYWIAGQNFWQSTVKYTTSPDEYVWRRERIYHPSTDTYTDWSYTRLSGVQGEQGPMGNPGQLGLYADGTTLYLKGFADDGTLTAENGNIYGDGQRLVVPAYSQNLTADGQGYVVFDGEVVQFAKLVADGASKRWIPYNGGDSIGEGFWVIGTFTKNGSSIYNLQIVFPERSQQFERSHFMDILAFGDIQNINVWAQANGIDQVFQRIAVLEAFIQKVFANKIVMSQDGAIYSRYTEDGTPPIDGSGYYIAGSGEVRAKNIELQDGAIYSGYTKDGNPKESFAGYHLSPDGILQAKNARLIGTLRTGLNALTNSRVSIRDESGIISGPTFVGSGLNDLTIINSGAVAVDAVVRMKTIAPIYHIGDTGPAGGKIFYVTNTTVYECSPPAAQSGRISWGPEGEIGLYNYSIGTGQSNTNAILARWGSSAPAASYADNLTYGGYSDWYLPSFDELVLAITTLGPAFGFYSGTYERFWSSNEYNHYNGLIYNYDGLKTGFTKPYIEGSVAVRPYVRAIRSFPIPKDTFEISVNNGSSYSAEIAIPVNKQYLIGGYDITFRIGSYNGHTAGNYWTFKQGGMKGLSVQSANGVEYVSASAGVLSATQINTQGTTNVVWGAVAN